MVIRAGITEELAKLKELRGSDFVKQLKAIAARKEFHSLITAPGIYTVGGENDADFQRLLDAAHKAVNLGYKVYLLPNPHDFRTADFIFERNTNAVEVMIMKGKQTISVIREDTIGPSYIRNFMMKYKQK